MFWLAIATAQAGIQNQRTGVVHVDLADAVAQAQSGDTLIFDGAAYVGGVTIPGIALTFQGNASTIDLAVPGPVLRLNAGASLTADRLLFTSVDGPGIDAAVGSVVDLDQCTFRTTVANGNGGGVTASDPVSITMTETAFQSTTVGGSGLLGRGGAIAVTSSVSAPVVLTDVTFTQTFANTKGGAIYVDGVDLACTGCDFDLTNAVDGGAVYDNGGSTLTFADSFFQDTTASGTGGAITTASPLTVTRTLFCNNSAGGNGGAVVAGGGGTLANDIFVDSTANTIGFGAFGNAVRAVGGSWNLTNDLFLGTRGADAAWSSSGANTTVTNTLFQGNAGAMSKSGGTLTADYNGFFQTDPIFTGGGATDLNDVQLDPRLYSFTDNGICGDDSLWPAVGSPLHDAGDPGVLDPDGSRSDIGAFGGSGADPAVFADVDGDGFVFVDDCDDTDATRYPGATELCDLLDNDCNGAVDEDPSQYPTWFEDCDGDGQGLTASAVTACLPPDQVCTWLAYDAADPYVGADCDDTDAGVFFGAPEHCAAGDQDCDGDGSAEELGVVDGDTYWLDADGDGYGNALRAFETCFLLPGYADPASGEDCNDADAAFHPGAPDACDDGVDQDCSGADGIVADQQSLYPDGDGDGFGDRDALAVLTCDAGLAGHVLDHTDCDDGDGAVNPDATEVCNGHDDDCDDEVDTDTAGGVKVTYYEDEDGDGFGTDTVQDDTPCGQPDGFVTAHGDCDDGDPARNPGEDEICNDVDDDCDDLVDTLDPDAVGVVVAWTDGDGDGFGRCDDDACAGFPACAYGPGVVDNPDDCQDASADVNPAATEIAGNTVDEDCDGDVAPGAETPPVEKGCNCAHAPAPIGVLPLGVLALGIARRRRGAIPAAPKKFLR